MHFSQLLQHVPHFGTLTGDPEVKDLTCDSREVREGFVFAAVPGFKIDGHLFIHQALERGACALVVSQEFGGELPPVPFVTVGDTREALGLMAGNFYGHPSRKLKLIGVTGTNGKTTTTWMIRTILRRAGHQTGLIGTLGWWEGDTCHPLPNTTPEPTTLQRLLARYVHQGASHAVMEVSSIALHSHRVAGMKFAAAVVTNITDREHLDYHGTYQEYVRAKALLLPMVDRDKGLVLLNADDPSTRMLRPPVGNSPLYFSLDEPMDCQAEVTGVSPGGSEFTATGPWGSQDIRIPLPGRYNVSNALAALAVCHHFGVEKEVICETLAEMPQVPGRFERINCGQPFEVVVDYAHTEDALQNLLTAARDCHPKRIITVFGCGGDRDRTKRSRMGKVAREMSDHTVITSDNPRSEDPGSIIKGITHDMILPNRAVTIEPDRRAAIRLAIGMAGPGDMVIIAGKGHEDYQILGPRTIHFDDREEAREALNAGR